MKPVKIIEIGAEGGCITLFGWKSTRGEWRFFRETDESTLLSMMKEDDVAGLKFQSGSETVTGWAEALHILSKYPWQNLYPLYVHPEFADRVWKEIDSMERENYHRCEWEDRTARKAALIQNALSEANKMDRGQGLIGYAAEKVNTKKSVIRQLVIDFLKDMEPLTPITLVDLYNHLETTGNAASSAAVRAALYGISVGCKVSERGQPVQYFAIKLQLNGENVFLSLPGVPCKDLKNDILSETRREAIITSFRNKYGEETINYWVQSAQYRSVSIAASGMRKARKRDNNTCKICKHLGRESDQPVSACHLVSRKSLFWEALEIVDKLKCGIFSNDAVIELKNRLVENELHSGTKFIITLCREHDGLVQKAIGESINKTNKNRDTDQPLLDANIP